MNPVPELAPQLKQLRLSGILDSIEARNRQAMDAKMPYTDFLALLIGDEVARRDQKARNAAHQPSPSARATTRSSPGLALTERKSVS